MRLRAMSRKRLFIIGLIGAVALVADVCIFTTFPQRLVAMIHASLVEVTPLESIHARLLQQTPIGSSPAVVYAFINQQRWGTFPKMEARRAGDFYSFQADMNYYRLTWHYKLTDVRGCWDFDSSNRLESITVFAADVPMGVRYRVLSLPDAKKP